MLGQIFHSRYKILEQLGSGGTAQVYKAFDMTLNRHVTIKVLREQFASDEEFVKRFQGEAQAVARLSHPNIVNIHDVVFDERSHYLVMEYVEGCNLKELIRKKGQLPLPLALNIITQILSGLEHAHQHGVIHRDIKPHNVLIDKNMRVRVTDFGIALANADITQTYTSDIVGSVHYMAPEQVKGGMSGTHTDIYSTAVVLYEMLTGVLPFTGDNAINIAMQHLEREIEPPHRVNSQVPIELSAVVMHGLRKNPALRYADCGEMLYAINKLGLSTDISALNLGGNTANHHTPMPTPTKKTVKKKVEPKAKKKRFNLVPLIILALVVGLGVYGVFTIAYSGGDNEIVVPNLYDMNYEEAVQSLEDLGLIVDVIRKNSDTVDVDNVMSQTLISGQTVKAGREITLTVSDGPVMVLVPSVLNLTSREAEVLIKNRGLDVTITEVIDENGEAGMVIEQSPEANEKIEEGGTMEIVVSLGKDSPVPTLTELTLEQATAKLATNNFQLGDVTEVESFEYVEGIVISQSIASGERLLEGSSIDLVVSAGPGPTASTARVTYTLPLSSVDDHIVKIIVNDSLSSHQEYMAVHGSGESIAVDVPFYGSGTITIYLDDEVVYSQDVES